MAIFATFEMTLLKNLILMNPRLNVKISSIFIFVILLFPNINYSQNIYAGDWEGIFLDEFRLIIRLNFQGDSGYTGNLNLYDGNALIQDDEISKIEINEMQFKFYLEAKQTDFEGQFNKELTELSGEFTFPDGSKHPLHIFKSKIEEQNKESSPETYWKLKNKTYSTIEINEDFNFLTEKLIEYHPQLYYYTSKESMNKLWNQTFDSIVSKLTLEEFYTLIAPVIEQVKCSHTGIRLPNQYKQPVNEYGNYLPLHLTFIDNKAYYLSDLCIVDSKIPTGSEILSINSIDIRNIMEQLFMLIPSEGNNQTTKYAELNHNFNSLYYFLDSSDSFEVEFLNEQDQKNTTTVSSCPFNDFGPQKAFTESDYPVVFSTRNNIGFLKIQSFAIPDIDEYIHQLDSVFLKLHNQEIPNLVIDLRNNAGGHPIFAAQLLSYLTKKEFIYFKRNQEIIEFEPMYNLMQPNQITFEGNIYVLINGGCLSTTGHLISLLKYYSASVFLGEEPGSTFRCNDFSTQLKLPNSGIEVNIPRTTFETAVSGPASEQPFPLDYKIETSINDILKGKDSYKAYLYKLVLENE